MKLIEQPSLESNSEFTQCVSATSDGILDDALKRGGSSLESVRECDRTANSIKPWADDDTSETESSQMPARQLTMQTLVQEVWGQSVRQNTTLVVIHSGNLEYICICHCASQTLYVSDLLHVPMLKDPGYGKLQVGLYISAVDDAMRRVDRDDSLGPVAPLGISASEPAQKPEGHATIIRSPSKRTRGFGRRRPRKRSSGDNVRDFADDESSDDLEFDINAIGLQACSRIVLYLRLQYDIFESIHPARFHRGPRAFIDSDKDSCRHSTPIEVPPTMPHLLLNLTSHLGHGATGVTHGGFVQTDFGPGYAKLKVAAKLAFTDDQQDDVVHEHAVYMHLQSHGVRGIPTVYGIFHDAQVQSGPSCLLMSLAGVSLHIRKCISPTPITPAQRDAFLAVLRSMHDAKVLHRDLRLENLLVQDSGDVAIIDFDQARLAAENGFKEEFEALQHLLEDLVDYPVKAAGTPEAHRMEGKGKARATGAAETVETSRMQTRGQTKIPTAVDEKMEKLRGSVKGIGTARAVVKVDTTPEPQMQTKAKTKTKAVQVVELELKRKVTAKAAMVGRSKAKALLGAPGHLASPGNAQAGPSSVNDDIVLNKTRMAGKMVLRPRPTRVRR